MPNPYGITEVDVGGALAMYTGAKDRRLQHMRLARQDRREETEFKRKEALLALMGKLRAPGGGMASAYDTAPPSPTEPVTASPTAAGPAGGPPAPAPSPTAAPPAPTAAPQPVPQSWMDANRDLIGQMAAIDAPTAFSMVQTFRQLDEGQIKETQTRNQALAVAAHHLSQIPEAERQAEFQRLAPGLLRIGIPQEMLAQADLSDRGLQWQVAQGRDIEKIIESSRPDLIAVEPGGTLYDKATGEVAFQSPVPSRVTGPDGTVYEYTPTPVTPPSSPGSAGPFQVVGVPGDSETSSRRSPQRNRNVGGVPNSYHLSGQASDRVPPPGMSMTAFAAELKRLNPTLEVINEGDHVHLEPRRSARRAPTKRRPTTKAEYDRLVKGARYIAPDGSERIKG
jgi:hypothetical protein